MIAQETSVDSRLKCIKSDQCFLDLINVASVFIVHWNKPTVPVWGSESFSSWCPAL